MIQERYDELEREKANLNLNSNDDKFQLKRIENEQADLIQQLQPQERLTFLQNVLDEVNSQEDVNVERRQALLNDISQTEWEIEQQQAKQEREQVQQQHIEAVDEMPLPKDFDEELGVPGLNDIIRHLLKDQYSKLFAVMNGREDQLHIDYKDKLRAGEDRELQLKRQNDEMQNVIEYAQLDNQNQAAEIENLRKHINNLNLEKLDSDQKRDAAVRELEEERNENIRLKEHINDLREELANAPAPSASHINITPTKSDSLDELVKKAKSFRDKSPDDMVNAFLERQKLKAENGGRYLVAPELHKSEAPITEEQFQSGPDSVETADVVQPGSEETGNGDEEVQGAKDVTRAEFEALKNRVNALTDLSEDLVQNIEQLRSKGLVA